MQCGLDGLLKNFPRRTAAWLLRRLLFPLGLPYAGPSDRLGQQCADLLLAPSEARDRLTRGLYLPTDEDQTLARLEQALALQMALLPVEKKLRTALKNGELKAATEAALWQQAQAQKIITEEEFTQWQAADAARREAITVDEFDQAALVCHPAAVKTGEGHG
jgi:acyl-CoA dehydrogenase